MSFLDDLFSGDGMSEIHGLIWIGLGIWAVIGMFFYLPAKKKQDKINEFFNNLIKFFGFNAVF